jgi:hypothetical protein
MNILDVDVPSPKKEITNLKKKPIVRFNLLSFLGGVLKEVVDKETDVTSLWRKYESLCIKKSLTNRVLMSL